MVEQVKLKDEELNEKEKFEEKKTVKTLNNDDDSNLNLLSLPKEEKIEDESEDNNDIKSI